MKKLSAVGIVSVLLTFILATSAFAAPDLRGTWNGTARKVTDSLCTTEAISLVLTQCPTVGGNLLRGTLTIRSASGTLILDRLKVVGRWTSNNAVSIHGTQGSGLLLKSVLLFGRFTPATATAKARIKVSDFSFSSNSTSSTNVEYDGFSLILSSSGF